VVACVLLLAGGLNNARQLHRAAGVARDLAAQRFPTGAGVGEER
jgi:outer membrane murein-binding lipoprotein Lpp